MICESAKAAQDALLYAASSRPIGGGDAPDVGQVKARKLHRSTSLAPAVVTAGLTRRAGNTQRY